jgi:hypothetical protein
MRYLGAAFVCLAILYGVDVVRFNGRYFDASESMLLDVYRYWR